MLRVIMFRMISRVDLLLMLFLFEIGVRVWLRLVEVVLVIIGVVVRERVVRVVRLWNFIEMFFFGLMI